MGAWNHRIDTSCEPMPGPSRASDRPWVVNSPGMFPETIATTVHGGSDGPRGRTRPRWHEGRNWQLNHSPVEQPGFNPQGKSRAAPDIPAPRTGAFGIR